MEIDWGNVLTALLLTIISTMVPATIKFLQAQATLQLAKAKDFQPNLTDWLEDCARFAVKAAEQGGLTGLIEDKKQYALSVAEAWLNAKGIEIDCHLLDAAIEKAVLDCFPHEDKKPVGFETK
jgi:hypothetical protein